MTARPAARKDHPEKDPHVAELGGLDVAGLSIADLKRRGITTGQIVTVAVGENEAWKTHSDLVSELRSWDVMDRSYARAAAADHVRRTGALTGLRLPRSFPCLGMLRVVAKRARMIEVECDGCGEHLGVAAPRDPRDEDEKPRRRRSSTLPEDKSTTWGF